METLGDKKVANCYFFSYYCEQCDYKCCKKFNFEKHLSTRKHQKVTLANQKVAKVATENATKIAERKAELAEFSKDLKDEELLDDKNYEIAKLKKEKSELEAKIKAQPETASVTGKADQTLVVGTKEKKESEIIEKQKRVDEYAFGKQA